MNRKGSGLGEILMNNAIYIILVILFFSGMFYYVASRENAGSAWASYYAQEVVKAVNLAEPGDELNLDVHKATEIAAANDITDFRTIFSSDDSKNLVCVQLSAGQKNCLQYFNDVSANIDQDSIELGVPGNILKFTIGEAKNEPTS